MIYSTDDLRVEIIKSLKIVIDNSINFKDLRNNLECIEKTILSEIKLHICNINSCIQCVLEEQDEAITVDIKQEISLYDSLQNKVDGELADLRAIMSQFLQYQANFVTMYQPGAENYKIMNETIRDMFINFINTLLQLNRARISLTCHISELQTEASRRFQL